MFDLNQAIARWRTDLAQRGACRTSDIDELEGHLREEIEKLIHLSLSQEEAFLVATHRLGDTVSLSKEFAKINPAGVLCHRVLWLAWGFFAYLVVASLATAAYRSFVSVGPIGGLAGQSLGIVGTALVLAGTLFLLRRAARRDIQSAELTKLAGNRIMVLIGVIVLLFAVVSAYSLSIAARWFGAGLHDPRIEMAGPSLVLPTILCVLWAVLVLGGTLFLLHRARRLDVRKAQLTKVAGKRTMILVGLMVLSLSPMALMAYALSVAIQITGDEWPLRAFVRMVRTPLLLSATLCAPWAIAVLRMNRLRREHAEA